MQWKKSVADQNNLNKNFVWNLFKVQEKEKLIGYPKKKSTKKGKQIESEK